MGSILNRNGRRSTGSSHFSPKKSSPRGWNHAWGAVTLVVALAAVTAHAASNSDLSVEQLKAKLSSTSVGDRPHLCVQIAQKQLAEADKEYAASEFEKGQAALVDVVAYSELARDYAIQSHKYQKQAEIAVRTMA